MQIVKRCERATGIYSGLSAKAMMTRGHKVVLLGTDVAFLSRATKAAIEATR